jgi:polyketide synthase PksN
MAKMTAENILITGGCGGLGGVVAHYLADKGGVNLILNGRSPMDQTKRAYLDRLAAKGCKSFYLQADVCDEAAMRAGLEPVRASIGGVHGVIHAAGLSGKQMLFDKEISAFQQVLDPKVEGTQLLDRVLADDPLRYLCYFSSTSAVLGDFGSCDYAVGNRFLMAYARHRNVLQKHKQRRGRAIAIAWPLWREGGMGFGDEATTDFYLKTSGQRILERYEGLALLERFLQRIDSEDRQPVVLSGVPRRIYPILGLVSKEAEAPSKSPPALVVATPSPQHGKGRTEEMAGWRMAQCLEWELREPVTQLLKVPRQHLKGSVNLGDFGFDSITLTAYAKALSSRFELEITPDLFFAHNSLDQLRDYFLDEYQPLMAQRYQEARRAPEVNHTNLSQSASTNKTVTLSQYTPPDHHPAVEPIAIIGMSGRFPGARTVAALWRILADGVDVVEEISLERYRLMVCQSDPESDAGPHYKWCGCIPGVDEFDPCFFGISPRDAELMDPRQRHLLQESWNALESAGYGPALLDKAEVGVFVGVEEGDYPALLEEAAQHAGITANHAGVLAARLSYFLNLDGPVMALNTACSSGLVAVHQACLSLRNAECDTALAAGVSLMLTQIPLIGMAQAGMLSSDGTCRAFDRQANGMVPGEAVAVVVLKRLSQARQDGDPILGAIVADGINYDGRTQGITAPSRRSQTKLLSKIYDRFDIDPKQLEYLIAHGTGTSLGDPVEIKALNEAFKPFSLAPGSCSITSTKSNLGHSFAASGVVSLIALIQALRHQTIPASLHCEQVNDYIDWQHSPLRINKQPRPWPSRPMGNGADERMGAVSSFGMSGTNAHLVVQGWCEQKASTQSAYYHLFVVSARSEEALRQRLEELCQAWREPPLRQQPLSAIAATLLDGRHPMRHRCAVVARDDEGAIRGLTAALQGERRPELFEGVLAVDFEPQKGLERSLKMLTQGLATASEQDYLDTLYALADLFCQGYVVAAADLYPGVQLSRVTLPGYPFAQEHYWAEQNEYEWVFEYVQPRETACDHNAKAHLCLGGGPEQRGLLLAERVEQDLRQLTAKFLKMPLQTLEPKSSLADLGFDSVSLARYAEQLSAHFGIVLTPDLFFAHPTPQRLAHYLHNEHELQLRQRYAEAIPDPTPSNTHQASIQRKVKRRVAQPRRTAKSKGQANSAEPIAILGMSGRFPKARNIDEMWRILANGEHAVDEIPSERFDWRDFYGDPKQNPNKTSCKWCAALPGVAEFDASFFEIASLEAANLDPRQRLLLQESWRALEDAGYSSERLRRERVGVFVGVEEGDYQRIAKEGSVTSNHVGVLAARLAYFLDLDGPVMALNTACSSALVALHEAVVSLSADECDLAVVAGVNLLLTPEPFIGMSQAGMLSPTGRCRAFDKEADGLVPGEAVAVVVLKRASRALDEHDPIDAEIIASAINYDGRTNGLTAPNRNAQTRLIQRVLEKARVTPADVDYIIAHGTGTPLGDPVEVHALQDAFQAYPTETASCALTSTKSNFGHSFAASGLVSLIALVQALRHQCIPATLHCETPSEYIPWQRSPFYLNRETKPWPNKTPKPRIGAVSAFGMSGTNAHLLVRESAPPPSREVSCPCVLLVVSAKNEVSLRNNAAALATWLSEHDQPTLEQVGYTLMQGRSHFDHRCAVVAQDRDAAIYLLQQLDKEPRAAVFHGVVPRHFTPQKVIADSVQALQQGAVALYDQPQAFRELSQGLAAFYCQGYCLSGDLLFGQQRRIHLPGYQFLRRHYWNAQLLTSAQTPETDQAMLLLEPYWAPVNLADVAQADNHIQHHIWLGGGVTQPPGGVRLDMSNGALEVRFEALALAVLERLKAILADKPQQPVLLQWVVSGDEQARLLEGVAAMLRSAARENPALVVQSLVLDDNKQPCLSDAQALHQLLTSCAQVGAGEMRYDGTTLLRRHWRERHITKDTLEVRPWHRDGVYLITGGHGGIGRRLAKQMVKEAPGAQVVLCGRSALSEQAHDQLPQGVTYQQTDVSDLDQVRRLIETILAEQGKLNGIVHGAGVICDSFIGTKQAAELQQVLRPKVTGVLNLDRATYRCALDFFLLFSSTSVFGNSGQADYAAANAFLDGFAEARNQRVAAGRCSGTTLAIDWPLWRDAGMRIDHERLAVLRKLTGMAPLKLAQGLAAISHGLQEQQDRLLVLNGEVARLKEHLPEILGEQPPVTQVPVVPAQRAAPQAPLLMQVLREVLLLPQEEPLDEKSTFRELGLDSLHVGRFIAKLSERLGVALRETLIFDYPTLGELARYLKQQIPEPELQKPRPTPSFKESIGRLARHHQALVPLQLDGEHTPLLFCIHPMSGDVGIYTKLAEAAHQRFRVIGIRSHGFLNQAPPLSCLESMGSHYAELIRQVDKLGPWHLLGTSMGGTLAYETARHLSAHGEVATLLMVEAPLIERDEDALLWQSDERENLLMNANFLMISLLHQEPDFRRKKAAGEVSWAGLEIKKDVLDAATGPALETKLAEQIRQRGVTRSVPSLIERLQTMARIHQANLRALSTYRGQASDPSTPQTVATQALFLRSASGDALSPLVYNPDYLRRVQRECGGMKRFFDPWRNLLPQLKTLTLKGDNHFDLLGSAATVVELVACINTALTAKLSDEKGTQKQYKTPRTALEEDTRIAVVGMAGRFPGADDLDAFWQLLRQGRSAISTLPRDRGWHLSEVAIKYGGFLSDVDRFDPLFFRIPPKEAQVLDPSVRLFLQEGWCAIEDAGIDPASLNGAVWGVYCGGRGDYTLKIHEQTGLSPQATDSDIPGRLSYTLGLTGPCQSIDAGCASSLLAVATACDHLLLGRCKTALAGGVMIHSTTNLIRGAGHSGLLTSQQQCYALDRRADGMLPGEGVAAVVLKRLSQAVKDHDRIHGVIEGWGSNHNGKTNGIAAPSVQAQTALYRQVGQRFGIDSGQIDWVEANATGTLLGDRVEIEALSVALERQKNARCVLGSVENNIGHAYQCSGMAHLLKVLLALRHSEIPATIHVDQAHEALQESPFFINHKPLPWIRNERPRRAMLNSFGATGTNVHLLVGEGPDRIKQMSVAQVPTPIVLSATTAQGLRRRCKTLADYVAQQEKIELRRLAANLALNRHHYRERCALVADAKASLQDGLQTLADRDEILGYVLNETGVAGQWARRYVNSEEIDWNGLFSASERYPLTLPSHPFEGQRCWLDDPEALAFIASNPQSTTQTPFGVPEQILADLVELVQEITGYPAEALDVQAPLSQYGLDSLMLVRLLAQVNERFDHTLQLADLMEDDSIAALARCCAEVREEDRPTKHRPPYEPVHTDELALCAKWLLERFEQLPESHYLIRVAATIPADKKSLSRCTQALSQLSMAGVGVAHGGQNLYLLAHQSVDVLAKWRLLKEQARQALLQWFPVGVLITPVSQQQRRDLYYSEVLGRWGWNVQHIYRSELRYLEPAQIDASLTELGRRYDLLRSTFLSLGETWGTVISGDNPLRLEQVAAEHLPQFQQWIEKQRSRLLAVAQQPLFTIYAARIEEFWHFGFVTHHALADAFTTTMLFHEWMTIHRALSQGATPEPSPRAEQYWQYVLGQWDRSGNPPEHNLRFWRKKFQKIPGVMRLPFLEDPNTQGLEMGLAAAHLKRLDKTQSAILERFNRAHGITFTQLFTAAIVLTLVEGMGNKQALIQLINNQRDRATLLSAPGNFTHAILLPLKAQRESTVLDFLGTIKRQILEGLRYAKVDFEELLTLAGIDGLEGFFAQRHDVVVDTADIDTAHLASSEASCYADHSEETEAVSMAQGGAIATLFFQIVKVNGVIHIIASYRKALFDVLEMQQLVQLIVDLTSALAASPRSTMESVLSNFSKRMALLREQCERFSGSISTEKQSTTDITPHTNRRTRPPFFAECQRLNHKQTGRPVFWFHGGLGGVEAYRELAQAMPRPFYGIQAKGWMTEKSPLQGIEAMSAYYVHIIRTMQPRGPYDLGGYSMGGMIAYEVTRQLQEQGEVIDSIVMLDTYDVIDRVANPDFNKKAMLGVVNLAIQATHTQDEAATARLVNTHELDCTADDQSFWQQLMALAKARGLDRSEEQLQVSIEQMTKFGHALENDHFTIRPLSDPRKVSCYYFRNKEGIFHGELKPYFTLPGSKTNFMDRMTYWSAWEANLPNIQIMDLAAKNHTTLLSEKHTTVQITEFCKQLYKEQEAKRTDQT